VKNIQKLPRGKSDNKDTCREYWDKSIFKRKVEKKQRVICWKKVRVDPIPVRKPED